MIESHLLADRMPSVAHRLAEWSPVESAHLVSCPECRLEWEIVSSAKTLGASAVAGLDPARVAAAVGRRLAEVPVPTATRFLRRSTGWLVGLAAAAALLFAVTRVIPERHDSGPVASVDMQGGTVLQELDDLTASELELLLETLSPAAEAAPHVEVAPLGDLDAKALKRVLRSLEG